jgi:hypothetical protein
VSGKLARADTLSALYALDDLTGADAAAPDRAQFAIVRYRVLRCYVLGAACGVRWCHVLRSRLDQRII